MDSTKRSSFEFNSSVAAFDSLQEMIIHHVKKHLRYSKEGSRAVDYNGSNTMSGPFSTMAEVDMRTF
jgi:hypothetical protein